MVSVHYREQSSLDGNAAHWLVLVVELDGRGHQKSRHRGRIQLVRKLVLGGVGSVCPDP
jgi:hypothetical protein